MIQKTPFVFSKDQEIHVKNPKSVLANRASVALTQS